MVRPNETDMILDAKHIGLGVSGGIAAYKACEVVRGLRQLGAEVRVAMTDSARHFVGDLTFATLSENRVLSSLFSGNEQAGISHIDLARWCDLLVICPATANVLGKIAHGLADDILTTTILATRSPIVFCPAMNTAMWENPSVQKNVETLRESGYQFVAPEWGSLATTGEGEGIGRLADVGRIIEKIKHIVLGSDELRGKKVVVTAGPTREAIDPVRFISNRSSGKMGFALAEAASFMGADVVLVSGAKTGQLPDSIRVVDVTTAEQMKNAVVREYGDCDILIMAAAVADYKAKSPSQHKIKKNEHTLTLALERTADILAELGAQKSECIHVGFALETEDAVANATQKLHGKNLDMIVLNNPFEAGAGFEVETNVATLITRNGEVEKLPKLQKSILAKVILNRAIQISKSTSRRVAVG